MCYSEMKVERSFTNYLDIRKNGIFDGFGIGWEKNLLNCKEVVDYFLRLCQI